MLCADLAYIHFTSVTYVRYLVGFYTPVVCEIEWHSSGVSIETGAV